MRTRLSRRQRVALAAWLSPGIALRLRVVPACSDADDVTPTALTEIPLGAGRSTDAKALPRVPCVLGRRGVRGRLS